MKFKPTIRQAVSQVFDILIPQNKWNDYMTMLDRDGHPNRRELVGLVLVFGKHIEQLELAVEELSNQLDLLNGKDAPEKPQIQEIKLRTVSDIKRDLEASLSPDIKALYLSPEDFMIYESTVNPNEPETQFGKEIDPKDLKEKSCLYYQDLPVFKQ